VQLEFGRGGSFAARAARQRETVRGASIDAPASRRTEAPGRADAAVIEIVRIRHSRASMTGRRRTELYGFAHA
jgi:hypothetical protein